MYDFVVNLPPVLSFSFKFKPTSSCKPTQVIPSTLPENLIAAILLVKSPEGPGLGSFKFLL